MSHRSQAPTVPPAAGGEPPAGSGRSRRGPGRDRYLDLLRGLAVIRVVVLHTAGAPWMTLAFPSMGIMFVLGGSLMASSLDRRGGGVRVIRGRLRRLLPPLWLLAAIAIPVMWWETRAAGAPFPVTWQLLCWVVPVLDPPVTDTETAGSFGAVLWYLRAYLWFVLLSPLLLFLFRLRPRVLLAAAVAGVAALSWYVPEGEAAESGLAALLSGSEAPLSAFVVYLACWLAGFAYHDGLLDRLSGRAAAALALALAVAGLGWIGYLHGELDLAELSLYDSPLPNTLLSLAFAVVLLRFRPGAALLDRASWLRTFSDRLSARAVTVYLWHYPALPFVWALQERTDGFAGWPVPGTSVLLALEFAAVLVAACAFGWAEDLAARRRPSLLGGGRRRTG
ncbi:acyltransferase [Streptomyces spongiicola]|uniref:Acyltransferase n=1 Tax=Streptomyces spongiicola TaxID=1690221 RepID=A0A388T091_9ACTN|nr:acyltransferase family protein [Streptomyces spongiicola]GBQ02189.1 acyltransferase [Streptomyces spongiicola]